MSTVALADLPASQNWTARFKTARDRAVARRLLGHLKLVSSREFETGLEEAITSLQKKLKARLAIYPVISPPPDGVTGYSLFEGALSAEPKDKMAGKRRQFGSEDRVGHFLSSLQNGSLGGRSVSDFECLPTLKQIKTQGLRHIVFVDDICGSGHRLSEFWTHVVPKRIKSLLSLHKISLWIVLYTITKEGRKAISTNLPNFPIETNLITVVPDAGSLESIDTEAKDLCDSYSEDLRLGKSGGSGYGGTSVLTIFEHGCPNNAPLLLWKSNNFWSALFPNRSIPAEIKLAFEDQPDSRMTEMLWRTQQPKLAIALLSPEAYNRALSKPDWTMIAILGLRLKAVPEAELAKRLLLKPGVVQTHLQRAASFGAYDIQTNSVTDLGKELLDRFRKSVTNRAAPDIGNSPWTYYPQQCEGKRRKAGKTAEGDS